MTSQIILIKLAENVSCGGSRRAPGCNLCEISGERSGQDWCSGDCFFDSSVGKCKELGEYGGVFSCI